MLIVLTHGCWDILTAGHLEHFRRAKEYGDYLVVSVSPDFIVKFKGDDRPVRPMAERMDVLRELRLVDRVWACCSPDATAAIEYFSPAWFIQGIDYAATGPTYGERQSCLRVGARWAHTKHEKAESTTALLQRIRACGGL